MKAVESIQPPKASDDLNCSLPQNRSIQIYNSNKPLIYAFDNGSDSSVDMHAPSLAYSNAPNQGPAFTRANSTKLKICKLNTAMMNEMNKQMSIGTSKIKQPMLKMHPESFSKFRYRQLPKKILIASKRLK